MRYVESCTACSPPLPSQNAGQMILTAFLACALLSLAAPSVRGQTPMASRATPDPTEAMVAQQAAPSGGASAAPASNSAALKPAAGTTAPGQANAANTAPAAAGGLHQGIKVHGHWVIEVRNPGGKTIQRREFENSLTGFAPQFIEYLLSGWAVPGGWYIILSDPNNPTTGSPCEGVPNGTYSAGTCYITQPAPAVYDIAAGNTPLCTPGANPCSSNLALSLVNAGVNPNTGLVLSGSIIATQVGNVGAVGTDLTICDPNAAPGNLLPAATVTPAQCGSGQTVGSTTVANDLPSSFPFTSVNLTTLTTGQCGGTNQPSCPVDNIQPGQVINVTVTLSFM